MAMVFDIPEEERRRLLALAKRYEEQLSELPKGTLSRKRRWNKEYYYLVRREGPKVRFVYIGPVSSDKAKSIVDEIKKRRELVGKFRKVQASLKEVERGLRGRN